jgi:hypothetical protein
MSWRGLVLETVMAEHSRSSETQRPEAAARDKAEQPAEEPSDAGSFDPHQAIGGSAFAGPLESGAAMGLGGGAASPATLDQEGVDRRA